MEAVDSPPPNVKDTNAVKVEIFLSGKWHCIGYEPKAGIPKVHKAMDSNEIVSVPTLSTIQIIRKTANPFGAKCIVLKIGNWARNETGYSYNCDLTQF